MTHGSFAALTPQDMLNKLTPEQRTEYGVFADDLKVMQGPFFDFICALGCFLTPTCRNDPHAHFSYCKFTQNPPVCFGLYEVPFDFLCFQPNDPTCLERFPLRCGRFLKGEDGFQLSDAPDATGL